MKAILYINGWMVGELDYELPRDSRGRRIATPSADPESKNDVGVLILANTDERSSPAWFGQAKLEHHTVTRAVQPSGDPREGGNG